MAAFKSIVAKAPRVITYHQTQAAGSAVDCFIFTNPVGLGESYEVIEVAYQYDVAGGASAAADVKISASGVALASGVSVCATVPDLTATARVPRTAALTTTQANRIVKSGDSIGIDTSGTLTGLVGLVVQVTLRPINVKKQK